MVITSIFAEAFLSVIAVESLNEAKKRFLAKPATKIFEDSIEELEEKKIIENLEMRDFLKLCDRSKYPESRKIIESAFRNLCITEQEKVQLFKDFNRIFSGEGKDLKVIFDEFTEIFLSEVIRNCRDSDWKYWVWMQLKQYGEQKILLESFEEALNFDVKEEKWFRGSPYWIDFEKSRIFRRKEVDIIKKKLKKGNIQIVFGEPASGKSVIIKYPELTPDFMTTTLITWIHDNGFYFQYAI